MNRRKILFNLVVIVAGAALGLAAGFALRSLRSVSGSRTESLVAGGSDDGSSRSRNLHARPSPPAFDDSPLATKLEHDLARASGITRWLLWLQAVEKAMPFDFPRLARLARNDPAALEFVAARWAAIAPRHFFDTLVAASRDGRNLPVNELARVLFAEWPKDDPEAAIAALSTTPNLGMLRNWRDDVATTVIKNDIERGLRLFADWHIENYMPFYDERGPVPQWAAANPSHAAEFAFQFPSSYLLRGVVKVIGEEWAKSDPAAALQFATDKTGQLASILGTAALKAWAEANRDQAADWLAGATDSTRNRFSPAFVEAWAKQDTAAAIAWSEQNLSGSTLSEAVNAAVQGAGVKQVAATADLIAAMAPSPARAEGALAVARQWFPMLGGMAGPSGDQTVGAQKVAWLSSLDPISIKRVLDEESWEWSTSDPGTMANFLLSITNLDVGTWPETCLARQMAEHNPTDALDWANHLPAARALAAGGEAYAAWRNSQPEAATEWLNTLPADDPRRTPFFESAIRRLAYNPQAEDQFAALSASERAAAKPVIESMTSLPADRRAHLLAGLTSQ